jgi:hypothetical protein
VLIKRNYTNLKKLTDNARNCDVTGIIYFNCHGNALSRYIAPSRKMCYQREWPWLAAKATKIFVVFNLYWILQSYHTRPICHTKVSVLQVKSSLNKQFLLQDNPDNTVHMKILHWWTIHSLDLTVRQQCIRQGKMTSESTRKVTQNSFHIH